MEPVVEACSTTGIGLTGVTGVTTGCSLGLVETPPLAGLLGLFEAWLTGWSLGLCEAPPAAGSAAPALGANCPGRSRKTTNAATAAAKTPIRHDSKRWSRSLLVRNRSFMFATPLDCLY